MTQRRKILEVDYISDDDCGMYRIGEIDTLPNEAIKAHVERFGEFGYQEWRDFGIQCIVVAETEIRNKRMSEQQACQKSV